MGFTGKRRTSNFGANSYNVAVLEDNTFPHAETERANYTVPTGYIAEVQSLFMFLIRRTAATAIGNAVHKLEWNYQLVAKAQIRSNNVGVKDSLATGRGAIYPEGAGLSIWTMDESTGGSIDYAASVVLTEYPKKAL